MKTANLKLASPWTRPVALAVATLVLALGSTGCSSECSDAFDCRNDEGEPPAGERWTCRDEKCETVPLDEEPVPDAGTDAGTPDAGSDAGDPCVTATHDAKLGTLQLQTGFQVGESVALRDDVLAVAASPGPTYAVYAVRGNLSGVDSAMYSLGVWPGLQGEGTKLQDVVSESDRTGSATVYPGSYLVADGKRLFAGYTTSATGSPGFVAVHDIATPANSTHVSSPLNFSAAAFSFDTTSALLVNGGGLGTTADALGVYALVTSDTRFTTTKVATFPENAGASGITVVAANGIAVLGYAAPPTYENQAYAVSPAALAQAVSSGTPVTLTARPKLEVGSNFNAAAAFGNGVALNRGSYDASFRFAATDVSRYSLTIGISDVAIGDRVPLLTYADQCTAVELMTPLGSDVLVGLRDKNGRRLVHIQQAP